MSLASLTYNIVGYLQSLCRVLVLIRLLLHVVPASLALCGLSKLRFRKFVVLAACPWICRVMRVPAPLVLACVLPKALLPLFAV